MIFIEGAFDSNRPLLRLFHSIVVWYNYFNCSRRLLLLEWPWRLLKLGI